MGGTAAFDQDRFRFRYDDGSLTAASWAAALNTGIVWPIGANIRCRMAIQETGGVRATNQQFYIYYSINGGTYTSGTPGSYQDSTQFTDEAADNVQRLGTGQTFTGGVGNDYYAAGYGSGGATDAIDFAGSDEWEIEFCFRVPTTCVFGDTVDFRAYRWNGSTWVVLNTYTNTPRITVAGTGKSSIPNYARGGQNPTSNWDCYMTGDDPRGHLHCYAKGFTPGRDSIRVWMRGQASKIPCFLKGVGGVKIAVVPFTARTNTGTTDITSTKLAGTTCRLALFYGIGASSYDTVTANSRIFFGAANGTSQFLRSGYCQDGYTSSQTTGNSSTSYCAGFYSASGGTASFDSFITNGVRINWSAGASAAFKCWAILIGSVTTEGFNSYIGSWGSGATPYLGELVNVTAPGFKPRSVLFHISHGSQLQMGMGLAWRDDFGNIEQHGRGVDWDIGYYNACGGWNVLHPDPDAAYGVLGYRGADDEDRKYHWKLSQFLDTGFQLECTAPGPYSDSSYYIAMDYAGDFEITYLDWSSSAAAGNNLSINTKNKALAVINITAPRCYCEYPYTIDCYGHGYMAFDDTNQEGGVIQQAYLGSPQHCNSIASQAADLLYDTEEALEKKATRVSMNYNGFTINYSTTPGFVEPNFIVFGQGIRTRSKINCYLAGHSRRQPCYTRGGINPTSHIHCFFNVVDAQSKISCYTDGQNPSRSKIPCYTIGISDAVIVVVPFTTNGSSTQDITTTELCGLTPKGAIAVIQWASLDSFSTGSQQMGLGFTDGTRSYYRVLYTASDTSHPYTYGRRRGYGYGFICLTNGSAGVVLKGTFNSWITNGIRVNWTTISSGRPGVMILFAGSSASCYAGQVTRLAVEGTVGVTAPGFTPDLIQYAPSDGASSEETEYASAMDMTDGMLGPNLATNDASRGQASFTYYVRSGGAYANPPYCVSAGNCGVVNYMGWVGANTAIRSFDSSGFTVYYGPSSPAGTDAYFAVGFGAKLRARIEWTRIYKGASGQIQLKWSDPNRNIMPIFGWLFFGHNIYGQSGTFDNVPLEVGNTRSEFNVSGYGALDYNGPALAIFSQSKLFTMNALSQGWYKDCNYEYSDLAAASYCSQSTLKAWWSSPDHHEWTQHFQATIVGFMLNGIMLNVTTHGNKWHSPLVSSIDENSREYNDWPLLIIGNYEEKSKMPCYMKGRKVDWRGRLPKRCFLQGVLAGTDVDSLIHAFTYGAEAVKSSLSFYMLGEFPGTSSLACFLHGYADTTSEISAYLMGAINEQSSMPMYLRGSLDVNSGSLVKLYLRGLIDDKSAIPMYLAGILGAKSSMPCYLQNGMEVKSSFAMYTRGDHFRGSIHCYCEGYPTAPMSSLPVFINGGGFWPFTDDFTGNDTDPWSIKWITDEQ